MVFNEGGVQLNEFIRQQPRWNEEKLIERRDLLVADALKLWDYPATDYAPKEALAQQVLLDDEDYDFKGKK